MLLPALAHKYAAVILDIKCLLKDDQVKEDASFIGAALKYLDSNIPGFPRLILTGDDSEFESLRRFYPDEKMFLKKPDSLQLLLHELEFFVQNALSLRLKRENIAVFDAFEKGLINSRMEATVIGILEKYDETNPANFKGIIGDIREVHEEVYKALNKRNKKVVPDAHMNGNGSPKFSIAFYNHLDGNLDKNNKYKPTTTVYQDSTLLSHTKFIHAACSEYLHGTSKLGYAISHYTTKALINSLMELIIWSKAY